jgi:hypothetical protein
MKGLVEKRYPAIEPGLLPTKESPRRGSCVSFMVSGLPPYKDSHFSIRNKVHSLHQRFVLLRESATRAMNGRKWYEGPISLEIMMYAKGFEKGKNAVDYMGGIMDSIDGSHGIAFTYLPIVIQDDCQVTSGTFSLRKLNRNQYQVIVTFL